MHGRVVNTMAIFGITLGDPRQLLQRGPAELRDVTQWTQRDSDILAHFLQVYTQLCGSSWYRSKKQFTVRGEKTVAASMPELEQFVFAAVYFRQLAAEKDSLLQDAADRYCAHVSCPVRKNWVEYEVGRFDHQLKSPPFPLPVQNLTFRQLFDAFLYGASLLHKVPKENEASRRRFLAIYDKEPRATLLYALNTSMQCSLQHVGNVAVVIYQDFANWQNSHAIPLPDVPWHNRLFDIPTGA